MYKLRIGFNGSTIARHARARRLRDNLPFIYSAVIFYPAINIRREDRDFDCPSSPRIVVSHMRGRTSAGEREAGWERSNNARGFDSKRHFRKRRCSFDADKIMNKRAFVIAGTGTRNPSPFPEIRIIYRERERGGEILKARALSPSFAHKGLFLRYAETASKGDNIAKIRPLCISPCGRVPRDSLLP